MTRKANANFLDIEAEHEKDIKATGLEAFRTSLTLIEHRISIANAALCTWKASKIEKIKNNYSSVSLDQTPSSSTPSKNLYHSHTPNITSTEENNPYIVTKARTSAEERATDKINHSPDITMVPGKVNIARDTSRAQQYTTGKPSTQPKNPDTAPSGQHRSYLRNTKTQLEVNKTL